MKISTKQPKGFQPITLSMTVETLDELLNLYARLNASVSAIKAQPFQQHPDVTAAVGQDKNELLFALLQYIPKEYR